MSEIPTMFSASTDLTEFVAGKTLPKSFHACPNREAALLSLCHSRPEDIHHLLALTPADWRKLLGWLDGSGLTLYLTNHIEELNLQGALPDVIRQRLQQNLAENRVRMQSLLRESSEIQSEFQRANISYAVVDGFSLWPFSVPKLDARRQRNLEYLIEESGVSMAREILERAGYRLHVMREATLEFRKDDAQVPSPKNMYKDGFGRTVELHIEAAAKDGESQLSRREFRVIEGIAMPVLAPADLFLRQGMEVFRGVCSPFLRASNLLEFYRHMCARNDDPAFWSQVRSLAEQNPDTVFGLGMVLNLIEFVMEGEIPAKLVTWTMLRIPEPAQRWISMYGPNCVYGMAPGTKLYLLLQREMERAGMSLRQPAGTDRLFRFSLLRMRFHVVEGLRYAWASFRWQRFGGELPV